MSMTAGPADQAWVDRQSIEDLIYRYADCVTRADWDQTEAVFAPNAIVEIAAPYDIKLEGAAEIRR
jgi:SnoaL-like domain